MRKLIFVMSALAALSMLAPSAGFAQFDYQNMVGLYADATDLTDHTGTSAGGLMSLYLVVTNPYLNYDNDAGTVFEGTVPVENINGFEATVTVPAGMFAVGVTFPPGGTNFATAPNLQVGYNGPNLVEDGVCVLAEISIVAGATADSHFYLNPLAIGSSIPGHMVVVANTGGTEQARTVGYPVSGDYANEVFTLNPTGGGPVATETQSWGNVKSLYR